MSLNYRTKRFSQATSTYISASPIQKKMADRLLFFFEQQQSKYINLPSVFQGLEIGCGTGHLTELLLQSFLKDKVGKWVISDLSKPMLDFCQRRLGNQNANAEWLKMSAYEIEDNYNLIVSNAVVQWLDLEKHLKVVFNSLEEQGLYLFSGFGQQHFEELYTLVPDLTSKKMAWKGGISQSEVKELSISLGFSFLGWWSEVYSVNYTSFWSFIQQIRKFGGSGNLSSTKMTITKLRKLEHDYQTNYATDAGVRVTWNPCYLLIKRGR